MLREEQNWIGGAASNPRNAEFIPPPHELIPELVDDLCAFCNREDVPAVIQAAIAHVAGESDGAREEALDARRGDRLGAEKLARERLEVDERRRILVQVAARLLDSSLVMQG